MTDLTDPYEVLASIPASIAFYVAEEERAILASKARIEGLQRAARVVGQAKSDAEQWREKTPEEVHAAKWGLWAHWYAAEELDGGTRKRTVLRVRAPADRPSRKRGRSTTSLPTPKAASGPASTTTNGPGATAPTA